MGLFDFFKKKNKTPKTPYVGLPTNEYIYKRPQATKKTSSSTVTAPFPSAGTSLSGAKNYAPLYPNVNNPTFNLPAYRADQVMNMAGVKKLESSLASGGVSGGTTSGGVSGGTTSKGTGKGTGGYSSGSTASRYSPEYSQALALQQQAYNRAMEQYNRAKAAYQAYYDKAARQRKANLDATLQANNTSADKSAQDAYVAYMNNLKNLPQQLRNAGVSGGGSETTIADIANTYRNNRNKIMTARDNNNSRAQLAYSQGVADDFGDYVTRVGALSVPTFGNITIKEGSSKSTSKSSSKSSDKTTSKNLEGYSEGAVSLANGLNTAKSNNTGNTSNNGNIADLQELYKRYRAMGMSDRAITKRLQQLGIIG